MSVSFATIGDALAATNLPVRLYCRIGGEPVDITDARTSHSVDTSLSRCTVTVPYPRPATLDLMAEIEVEAGYPGQVHRIFHGVIPDYALSIDDRGKELRVTGVGYEYYLTDPDETGLLFGVPISLKEVFRGACEWRQVPSYFSEETYLPDGTEIMLGEPGIDDGVVTIDNRTSPRSFLDRASGLFGYRAYGRPDGAFVQSRVSGLPDGAAAVFTFTEGVDCFRINQSRDVRTMHTYWEVEGASYTDEDGIDVQVRSTPDEVEGSDYLPPLGYRKATISDNLLVNTTLADGCRNVMEIDYGAPSVQESFEVVGNPLLMPGSVVAITSASMESIAEARWVMSVDHDIDDRGYTTTFETWAGSGEALGAGDDCTTETITIPSDGVAHLGNETISWYKDPSPDGSSVTVAFTVSNDDYSSLRLSGLAHGTNTYNRGRKTEPSTGSVVEVWQLQDPSQAEGGNNELRRVGSMELPTLDEEYSLRRNYGASDTYWTAFSLPMPGRLLEGAAELRIIAGKNPTGTDDFEIKDLRLTYCGVGAPSLPEPGGLSE